jgi:hypothetical protein
MNESHYMFVYWIIGTFNNDIETLTLTVGIVRSFESVGSAVAFGLGAAKGVAPMTNLIVAFVMFVICIPTTTLVVFEVPEHPLEKGALNDGAAVPIRGHIERDSGEEGSGKGV